MLQLSKIHLFCAVAICLAPGIVQNSFGAHAVEVEVAAGGHDRHGTVVAFDLPDILRDSRSLMLMRIDTGRTVPVQIDRTSDPRAVWIIRDKLQAGGTRRYRLSSAAVQSSTKDGVRIEDDGRRLWVKVRGKPVLAYNHAVVPSQDPLRPYFARSGHIHPVFNPAGRQVTDDFSPDHPHQHGIMFAWSNCTFQGRNVNFWAQSSKLGTVEHVKLEGFGGGPVFGSFAARLHHVALEPDGGRKPVLEGRWRVRVYNFSDYFLFDIESEETCIGDSPLKINKHIYSGLMVRGNRGWLNPSSPAQGGFLTSEGKTRDNGDGSRPRWCDIHGPIDGQETGIMAMTPPDAFRFPQSVRLHPSMPYFAITPARTAPMSIEPGKPYRWRYRFYVHQGMLESDVADHLWHDYAYPPEICVIKQ